MAEEVLELVNGQVRLLRTGPEDERLCERTVAVDALLEWLAVRAVEACGWQTPLLVPGTRLVRTLGRKTVIVLEQAPQVRRVLWVDEADTSSAPFGRAVSRRLAFPYLVFLLSFEDGELDGYHQLYYRRAPLDGQHSLLLQANLLNVTRGRDSPAHWLCLGQRPVADLAWPEKVQEAMRSFWETPFNLDFEVPRGSGFTRLCGLDTRLASAACWEVASHADPLFPLSVPWPEAGLTLEQAVEESLSSIHPPRYPTCLRELADALYRLPSAVE